VSLRSTDTFSGGEFDLAEHLPYLLKHIYSQLQVASARHLAQFGVSVAVWRILAVLWEHGDLSHRELADLTSIEVSTLSRLSKSAKRDGLIRRKRTREDQRTVRVTLTEKGRNLTQAIIPSALSCQADTIGNLCPEDVNTVTRILHTIVENLTAHAKTNATIDEAGACAQRMLQASSCQDARLLEIEPGVARRELLRDSVTEIE
jgi:MarR family transcriptional regulator, organic hydroperoxide resistance regulator